MNRNEDFYDELVRRLGSTKAEHISTTIHNLLRGRAADGLNTNNADYANAFGFMQGVAATLGYTSVCISNVENSPGHWFAGILSEYPHSKYMKT